MFPSTEPKSVALWTGIRDAQRSVHALIVTAHDATRKAIIDGDLSEFDGFSVLTHLMSAMQAMAVAVIKAERELAQHKKTASDLHSAKAENCVAMNCTADKLAAAEPKSETNEEPEPQAKDYATVQGYIAATEHPNPPLAKPPPETDEEPDLPIKCEKCGALFATMQTAQHHKCKPKPAPPAADEGDVEVVDEPQPADEPVEPPKKAPPPPKANGKPVKTQGHVEQLIADIKTELARFADWGQYAAVFFDNKTTDVDVLAGKVVSVPTLSAILAALKKLPPVKPTGKG